jgi:hypothetical protein
MDDVDNFGAARVCGAMPWIAARAHRLAIGPGSTRKSRDRGEQMSLSRWISSTASIRALALRVFLGLDVRCRQPRAFSNLSMTSLHPRNDVSFDHDTAPLRISRRFFVVFERLGVSHTFFHDALIPLNNTRQTQHTTLDTVTPHNITDTPHSRSHNHERRCSLGGSFISTSPSPSSSSSSLSTAMGATCCSPTRLNITNVTLEQKTADCSTESRSTTVTSSSLKRYHTGGLPRLPMTAQ